MRPPSAPHALGCIAAAWIAGTCAATPPAAPAPPVPSSAQAVLPGVPLRFPQDFGSHPQFGIEWWYITGWLYTAQHRPLGFQITFFRVRRQLDAPNPSAFAPQQILIAHLALSDPQRGRLWQEQRIRRAGLGLVQAAQGDTDVVADDWRLQRQGTGAGSRYLATLQANDFALQLQLTDPSGPVLNGVQGFSQKGPQPRSASYYYSEPHLSVQGSVVRAGHRDSVSGEAWLDHEWASEYLDPAAQGWDWVGLNLAGGGSLMAFQIRDHRGRRYWAGGTLRDGQGHVQVLSAGQVQFQPLRSWRSPRSGISYPVAQIVQAGGRSFWLEPLMDNQEFDSRTTSGALYWEGAVRVRDGASLNTSPLGEGYLELTGYDRSLSLR